MPIRVYIVEDHPVMRETLVAYLGLSPDIELCGMASTAEEASEQIEASDPSLVLLDLSLPGRSGLDLLSEITQRWQYPCVILSGHGEQGHVGRAFAAGARGYVLKGTPHEVPVAIRSVMDGQVFLSDSLRKSLDYADRGGFDR